MCETGFPVVPNVLSGVVREPSTHCGTGFSGVKNACVLLAEYIFHDFRKAFPAVTHSVSRKIGVLK